MENPATWREAERTIFEAQKAWQKSHEEGVIGYSQPASIAIALRKAGLLNEISVDELLELTPTALVEQSLKDAITKLSEECSEEQLELFNKFYPQLRRDNLEAAYKLLARTVIKNRKKPVGTESPEPLAAFGLGLPERDNLP